MFLAYSVSRLVLGREAAMNLPDCFLKLAGAGNEANENSLWTERKRIEKGDRLTKENSCIRFLK